MGVDRAFASGSTAGRAASLRRVIDAIFYLLQTGCPWRMLPRDFPPRSTVYGYFRTWIVAGVWAHVQEERKVRVNVMLDAEIARRLGDVGNKSAFVNEAVRKALGE